MKMYQQAIFSCFISIPIQSCVMGAFHNTKISSHFVKAIIQYHK